MNKDLRALEGECEMNTNKEVKIIDEPTERLDNKIKNGKIEAYEYAIKCLSGKE